MGHESQIEPWLPLTTVLLVSFRADWLRREETMKTARKENRNCWAAVFSIRVDGLAGQNSALITWGWKQEKLQPSREKNFLLTSPSIELPSGSIRPELADTSRLVASNQSSISALAIYHLSRFGAV
jgi:hypothetical protein